MARRSARNHQQSTKSLSSKLVLLLLRAQAKVFPAAQLEEIDDTERSHRSDDSPDNYLDDTSADDLDHGSLSDLDDTSTVGDTAVIMVECKREFRWFCSCGNTEGMPWDVETHYARVHLRSKYYECQKHKQGSVVVSDLI
jgi:hypothetical protein